MSNSLREVAAAYIQQLVHVFVPEQMKTYLVRVVRVLSCASQQLGVHVYRFTTAACFASGCALSARHLVHLRESGSMRNQGCPRIRANLNPEGNHPI